MVKRLTLELCHQLAKEKGGLCLSTEYKDCKTKLLWKCCNENHESWETRLSNIRNKNTWCPKCFREKQKLSIEICHQIAQERNGLCLSTVKNEI